MACNKFIDAIIFIFKPLCERSPYPPYKQSYFCEKQNSLQQDAAGTLSKDEAESTLVIAVEAVFPDSAVPQRPTEEHGILSGSNLFYA